MTAPTTPRDPFTDEDVRRKAYCDHAVDTAMRLVETYRDPPELVAAISAPVLDARQDEQNHAYAKLDRWLGSGGTVVQFPVSPKTP